MSSHLDWADDDPRWEDEAATDPVGDARPLPPVPRPAPDRRDRLRRAARAVGLAVAVVAGVGAVGSALVRADRPAPGPACAPATTDPPDAGRHLQHVVVDRPGRCPATATYDRRRAVLELDGRRYLLGEPGDRLLVGDWDCDGTPTPALHRPDAGLVFRFGGWADDEAIEATHVERVAAGRAVKVAHRNGCDLVEVR